MRHACVTAALPGTAGELVQGLLDGEPCLVSCPIGWFSRVRATVTDDHTWHVSGPYPKVQKALHLLSKRPGFPSRGGRVEIQANIPRGRGYGSSTADVAAALYAVAHAVGHPLSPATVARLAVEVEPTDSTVFPGLALFAHRTGAFWEMLGPAPPLAVIVLDPGGKVDTLTYNRQVSVETLRPLATQHREAFNLLRWALRQRDWHALGEAATLSACTHQQVLPNPLVDLAVVWRRAVGALGICRAHSGTLVGILCHPEQTDVQSVISYLCRHLPAGLTLHRYALTDGGPRYLPHQVHPTDPERLPGPCPPS